MKGKILLVDDNVEFLDSVKDVLDDKGYDVVTADNGAEALRLVSGDWFDVVLMDIKMPGMNGVECFIEMKKLRPEPKVILMTAYSVEELIRQAFAEGVYAVLSKPLDMSVIFDRIDEIRKQGIGGMVLVADDDKALCDNLADILTNGNFKVFTAYNGSEAIRQAESHAFDILLVDMKLPMLNGLEVYRRIKRIRPEIVAIVISGYANEMDDFIRQTLDESAYTFLNKPLEMGKVLELLNVICTTKRDGSYRKPGGRQP